MKKPKILVVGSLAMDLIVSTGKMPGLGETVMGKTFHTAQGGKGSNQAVQAAKLGAEVTMVGRVGNDAFGQELIASQKAAGIDTRYIKIDPERATGIAFIIIQEKPGEKNQNYIIVAPGSNRGIQPEDVAFLKEEISRFDMVLLQHEIPMEINELVARYAYEKNVPVMLNPAPFEPISPELLSHLTYISPNEYEAADLTGVTIRKASSGEADREDVTEAVRILREKGVKRVIITLGSAGAVVFDGKENIYSPCVDVVEVKDPTAAGDSFVGAFCTGIGAGLTHRQALDFANYAATITVSRMGAQPSLPTMAEVLELMKKENFTGFPLSLLED